MGLFQVTKGMRFCAEPVNILVLSLFMVYVSILSLRLSSNIKNDIFMSSNCGAYMKYSLWKKCLNDSNIPLMSQYERMKLNILGPYLSSACFLCPFSDSKDALYVTSCLELAPLYLITFAVLIFFKRYNNGLVSPYLCPFAFLVVSAAKWYCVYFASYLLSPRFPLYFEFYILNVGLNVMLCLMSGIVSCKKESTTEVLLDKIDRDIEQLQSREPCNG